MRILIASLALVLLASSALADSEQEFFFVPKSVSGRLEKISASKQSLRVRAEQIRNQFCDGSRSRINIEYKLKYTPPSVTGLPLDQAAEVKQKNLSEFRQFLKKEFFYVSGRDSESHTVLGGFQVPYALDTSLLIALFTFKIPRPQIAKLLGYKHYDSESFSDNPEIQNWGYDYDTGKFGATLALKHASYMWEEVMGSQTTVLESPNPDGSVNFSLKLDLSAFCSFGIGQVSLISE